jgi:hypothetical protein
MSYSINVTEKDVPTALQAAAAAMAEVVKGQPIHARDQKQALAALTQVLKLLQLQHDSQKVNASLNGSLGWVGNEVGNEQIVGATINVSVWLS